MRELSILALLLVIPLAYAEEPLTFDREGDECVTLEHPLAVIDKCQRTTIKEFNASAFQDNSDDPLAQKVLEGIDYLRSIGEYIRPPEQCWEDCNDDTPTDDKPVTSLDWVKKRACESDRNSDKELCNHLNQLSSCEQGVTETESEPVSTYRKFAVSDGEISKLQNFDLADNQFLRDVYLKIEECYAIWQVLQPTVLGAQYLDFIRQSDDLQPYHADMTTREAIRTDKLNEASFSRTLTEAQLVICYSEFYGQKTKDIYDCPKPVYDNCKVTGYVNASDYSESRKLFGLDPPKDGEVWPVKDCSPWKVIKNPNGTVLPVGNSPMEEYMRYMADETGYTPDGVSKYVIIDKVEGDFAIKVENND